MTDHFSSYFKAASGADMAALKRTLCEPALARLCGNLTAISGCTSCFRLNGRHWDWCATFWRTHKERA